MTSAGKEYDHPNVVQFKEALGEQGVRGLGGKPGLSSGGGGMDGLEPRVAKLEAYVENIRNDIAEIRPDLKDVRERMVRLEERVSHLPTHWHSAGVAIAIVVAVGALVAFQGQIQTFFNLSPTVQSAQE